ncbi:heterodisulfide reductase-related iron-sulfur binding cluster [Aciditerrimonas ferrireducens]|jgi:Fe-S oxidoreductase/nitrate reductase gamma subunit|uniref:Heterodisulfide reductase-related iron-sulfur binding cluster n=1 Tax=Aciditerrimonas ferrireducens TaxID=667306 RepID=A0ABV6BZ78_9ACTN|nr:(Fe-S)-binding protein [Aciditerrimonas ferrireducens]MCK4177285.1 4Fe-4S dicluster domain-containing protein [Aciditerrimonas ferrireducens]
MPLGHAPMLLALPANRITRPIFGGETETAKTVFYVLALLTVLVFAYGWFRRVRKYERGRRTVLQRLRRDEQVPSPSPVVAPPRLGVALWRVLANTPVRRRNRAVGTAHLLLFWGFTGLFLATVILSADYDVYRNVSRWITGSSHTFFDGTFYEAYNAVFNAAGLLAVVGLVVLMVRRARSRGVRLDYRRAEQPTSGYSRVWFVLGDWVFSGSLLVILLTGFGIQGLRILHEHLPGFERWTWLGYAVAEAFRGMGVSPAAAGGAHAILWWVHVGFALAFVAYVPYSKAMHMLTAPVSLLATNPGATRRLPPPPEGKPGYVTLADFSSKELLDLDSCTKCGRCHEACPARTSGAPLSPRDLILDLRQWADHQGGTVSLLDWETRPEPSGPVAGAPSEPVAGTVVPERTLWACTTCMACVELCPVGIEHVPLIVNLRRSLVDQGRMEPTLQTALQALSQQGNSFGKSARMRARWTKGLSFEVPDARKEPVEYLWWVGDFASFDDRVQGVSRQLAELLHAAGISFGLLYEDERNAGNDVRRVGEEGLFELLVERNLAAMAKADFQTVLTTDPHTFNTMRNEYPQYGFDKPVRHYTQLLAELLESGRIPVRPLGRRVTYHDPCYLGRYNRITDPPRRVLAAIGCELVEMPRNREATFCCGAGGGRIWMVDDPQVQERPSENRIKEAAALGVDTFVVACPKDFTMYSDAVKTTGHEQDMTVVDLVQLVAEAMAPTLAEAVAG